MSETTANNPAKIETTDDAIVVRPGMKMLDDESLKRLARSIDEAATAAPGVRLVVLDLADVVLLPSLALGVLVQISNACRSRQQALKLAAVRAPVRQVFAITRLDRLFQFAESVEASLR